MKLLCKIKAGSHLFGTNRPESDVDYKGVFIPDPEDILMGSYKHTVCTSTGNSHSKNTADDVDIELYSLKKFFDMLYIANNHALEILFAPDNMVIETSPEWEFIRSMKEELVCKKIENYIEYCNSQATKYGVKGSRVHAVKVALISINEIVKSDYYKSLRAMDSQKRLELFWDILKKKLTDVEHIRFIDKGEEGQEVDTIEIVNRKFQSSTSVKNSLIALTRIYDNYGARAKQAELNKGIDWKAISHAYRVGMQAYELLETGKITLPMAEPYRSKVKALKCNDKNLTVTFDEIRPVLESLADNLKEAVKRSTIKESINEDIWNTYVKMQYSGSIVEWYKNNINES